jgi:mono/diheme cytochrome c family protein
MKLTAALLGILASAAASAATSTSVPTYNKDIAPILYKNCANCHRPGEVAPFSLLTYQDSAKRAGLIAAITKARVMPPWKAEPGYGDFKDVRRLTDEQLAMLQEWAKNGAPEGDPADKPTLPHFTDGWQLGQPDKVFQIPSKYSLPGDGADQYRCFVIPLDLEKDMYVGAIEFRPDNRRIVHHALVFADANRKGRQLAAGSTDGSYTCFGSPGFAGALIGGWAPGATPYRADAGTAVTLRKGTDLVLQLHYHPSGKPEQDQSSLGLSYGDPPTKGRTLLLVGSRKIDIQPGDSHYVVKTSVSVPQDVDVLGIAPHAHYLCKDMKVTAHLPDGTVTPLIWIKDWDFNWQGGYRYTKPVKLPKGTEVELEYTYDNSTANPHNPTHPPVHVTYGEQTTNEMALAFISVAVPTPADALAFQRDMRIEFVNAFLKDGGDFSKAEEFSPEAAARLQQAVKLFDKNQNGKLDPDEREALIKFLRERMQ